jgi:hypothetical protein
MDAMIEKEPVTVILSQRGWIRAARGHLPLDSDFKFKEGDGPAFAVHAQTTDKLLLAADNGRFFTLGADKLPGARGFGEPIRNTLDIDSTAQIAALMIHRPEMQVLLAASTGKGFAAVTDELLAECAGRSLESHRSTLGVSIPTSFTPRSCSQSTNSGDNAAKSRLNSVGSGYVPVAISTRAVSMCVPSSFTPIRFPRCAWT